MNLDPIIRPIIEGSVSLIINLVTQILSHEVIRQVLTLFNPKYLVLLSLSLAILYKLNKQQSIEKKLPVIKIIWVIFYSVNGLVIRNVHYDFSKVICLTLMLLSIIKGITLIKKQSYLLGLGKIIFGVSQIVAYIISVYAPPVPEFFATATGILLSGFLIYDFIAKIEFLEEIQEELV
jgi:hypothetical protein